MAASHTKPCHVLEIGTDLFGSSSLDLFGAHGSWRLLQGAGTALVEGERADPLSTPTIGVLVLLVSFRLVLPVPLRSLQLTGGDHLH